MRKPRCAVFPRRIAAALTSLSQPVEFGRRTGEEGGPFGGGAAGSDALKGVPQHAVAAAALVDREVALEHCALGAEGRDAGLDIGPPGSGQFLGARRQFAQVMGEAEHAHAEAAELDVHIGAGGELVNLLAPRDEDFVALAGVGVETDRATDVVEHDLRPGEGARRTISNRRANSSRLRDTASSTKFSQVSPTPAYWSRLFLRSPKTS